MTKVGISRVPYGDMSLIRFRTPGEVAIYRDDAGLRPLRSSAGVLHCSCLWDSLHLFF